MDRKRAAALAAVMHYLQQEAAELEAELLDGGTRGSGWSASGRKALARGRQMVQSRRIRGKKTRARFSELLKRQDPRLRMR
jgi:hypothetical protein